MKFRSILSNAIVLMLTAITLEGCITNKEIAYLQDMKNNSQIQLENQFEAVISPYDELDVIISSYDQELAKPFNLYSAAQGVIRNGSQNLAYLVDQYGNIELPVLGEIHAEGMTRLQLQEVVRNKLISGGYISDPYVMVRFRSFKVFFLGSNGGKAISIPNERCTFLEALALSGDMNIYTNRSKIRVMREIDGKMVTRYLDPRSSKVFDDPFFMLQQNDFIITQNTSYRNFQQSYSQFGTILNIVSSLTGLATTYFAIMAYINTTNN